MKVSSRLFVFTVLNLFTSVLSLPHFGYSPVQQRKWSIHNNECAGQLQSPISIQSSRAISLRMPAIEFVRYHDLLPGPIEIHNNGHSVSLGIPKLDESDPHKQYIPYIFGGRLNNEYELQGLHFHWGGRNNRGSEHIINDIQFPMEMHIIHMNRKYSNISVALQNSDGLAVLAFFYQIREKDNRQLLPIVKALPPIEEFDSSIQLKETFTLASLLPPSEELDRFYTYRGSLTTPPCSEAVTWILFPDPIPVSTGQMHKFRSLTAGGWNLLDNYRQLQPLGNRRVFVRKLYPRGAKSNTTVHYSQWDWLQEAKPNAV